MSEAAESETNDRCSPVAPDDERPPSGNLDDTWGLCLSGGGYRAMLFHIGALWRLNEAGYLPKLGRISSVSGGSITAGVLALHWSRLNLEQRGVSPTFVEEVVAPLRRLADKTIDIPAVLRVVLPGAVSDSIISAYSKHLFGEATLQDLPDSPRFVINATNLQSGALWRFMKPYMRDYKVGEVKSPRLKLAVAVAASSAFPPVLSPVRLSLDESAYTPGNETLHNPPYTTKPLLSDGGVYDNLGLETVWKRCKRVLVSDGGALIQPRGNQEVDWLRQSLRAESIIDNQVRSLRKRQVIDSFDSKERLGAYWGIGTAINKYGIAVRLNCSADRTIELANSPTRLGGFDSRLQDRLINWGYAVSDAALRRHVDPALPDPKGFPYQGGVD